MDLATRNSTGKRLHGAEMAGKRGLGDEKSVGCVPLQRCSGLASLTFKHYLTNVIFSQFGLSVRDESGVRDAVEAGGRVHGVIFIVRGREVGENGRYKWGWMAERQ